MVSVKKPKIRNIMENQSFKATVTGDASKTFDKANGGEYVLHACLVTEGPLNGKTVTGTRTIANAEGEQKDPVAKGDQVVVYPRKSERGKWFFEISTAIPSISDDEINALMGTSVEASQTALDAQSIS